MPVHWAGRPCELDKIKIIAKKYNLKIVQDGSQGIDSRFKKKQLVYYGDICTYSMHPLKNLNIWGDGGFIATNNKKIADKLYLLRNHGLENRNNSKIFGYNSRLDTIQAVVANYKLKNKLDGVTKKRMKNSNLFDKFFKINSNVRVMKRLPHLKEVFHLYHINVNRRDQLQQYLISKSVDAKTHYPIPIHLQSAAKYLKHKRGDFPVTDRHCKSIISFPCDQHLSKKQMNYIIQCVKDFYSKK
jgi:dTDP-4-amino-4,6-dideoxygalactose transaminase